MTNIVTIFRFFYLFINNLLKLNISITCNFLYVLQVNRLEGQVSRYKNSADNAEKIEDELKAEKRKLQREV